jgi:uncharacterized protein (DUF2267 family)
VSSASLDVFDKTLQTTHIWLDQIMEEVGPDRQVAWHVLGATLRALRDRLPLGLAAHLGAQLPILIRGIYYDQWSPAKEPLDLHSGDDFLQYVARDLTGIRPVNVRSAVQAVFATINKHVPAGQVRKVCSALPKDILALWPADTASAGTEYDASPGQTKRRARG